MLLNIWYVYTSYHAITFFLFACPGANHCETWLFTRGTESSFECNGFSDRSSLGDVILIWRPDISLGRLSRSSLAAVNGIGSPEFFGTWSSSFVIYRTNCRCRTFRNKLSSFLSLQQFFVLDNNKRHVLRVSVRWNLWTWVLMQRFEWNQTRMAICQICCSGCGKKTWNFQILFLTLEFSIFWGFSEILNFNSSQMRNLDCKWPSRAYKLEY